jgi:hypothetical protein
MSKASNLLYKLMGKKPNLPEIRVTEEFGVDNINEVLLGEFADTSAVEIIGEETNPVAVAKGLRLVRVYSPNREILTEYDANLDKTPLDFIGDKEGIIIASARPGDTYTWQLVRMGKTSGDMTFAPITGVRLATAEESATLDTMYPEWLTLCQKFDIETEAMAEAAAKREELIGDIPPPQI